MVQTDILNIDWLILTLNRSRTQPCGHLELNIPESNKQHFPVIRYISTIKVLFYKVLNVRFKPPHDGFLPVKMLSSVTELQNWWTLRWSLCWTAPVWLNTGLFCVWPQTSAQWMEMDCYTKPNRTELKQMSMANLSCHFWFWYLLAWHECKLEVYFFNSGIVQMEQSRDVRGTKHPPLDTYCSIRGFILAFYPCWRKILIFKILHKQKYFAKLKLLTSKVSHDVFIFLLILREVSFLSNMESSKWVHFYFLQ